MIYTIDNPKLVKNVSNFKGLKSFTGVVKDKYGAIVYFLNGKTHRTDGPAIEWADGSKEWFLNGGCHRDNGPAIEANGNNFWYLNGELHREDGPATEWSNGDKRWYLNGEFYGQNDDFTNESWIRFVKLELLK